MKDIQIRIFDLQKKISRMSDSISDSITQTLESADFIQGMAVKDLETDLEVFVGNTMHTVTVGNGTDALVIALKALGIGAGDEVIVPAFTYVATAEAVILSGATVVFADVVRSSGLIDPESVKNCITRKTRAIIGVSLFGERFEIEKLRRALDHKEIFIIEDAAQSFGAIGEEGEISCSDCDAACTSFFPTKPLGGLGDGGACFFHRYDHADFARKYRQHGQVKKYFHETVGTNSRLDTIQAAVLRVFLKKLDSDITVRNQIFRRFDVEVERNNKNIFWRLKSRSQRAACSIYNLVVGRPEHFCQYMEKAGVETAIYYPRVIPDQPAYVGFNKQSNIDNARFLAQHVVSIPAHQELQESEIRYIEKLLQEYRSCA